MQESPPPAPVRFERVPPHPAAPAARERATAWWWPITLIALVVAVGYLGFRYFITDFLPNPAAWGLVPIAVAAGAATFFNPCSFPLLPGYLTHYYQEASRMGSTRPARLGWAAAGGVVTFTVILGLLIALAGAGVAAGLGLATAQPSVATIAFRVAVGSLLVTLGAMSIAGFAFHRSVARHGLALGLQRSEAHGAARKVFLYGFGYNAVGIGCGGPILAGLVVFALGAGGFWPALAAFLLYGATMGILMLFVSRLAQSPGNAVLAKLRANTGRVKKAAGATQIAVGLFLIAASVNTAWFVKTLFP